VYRRLKFANLLAPGREGGDPSEPCKGRDYQHAGSDSAASPKFGAQPLYSLCNASVSGA
jgi:hypothetical protein